MTMTAVHAVSTKATDDDTQLHPQFGLRFERLPSHPGRGFCLVDVLLSNSGSIAASFPFLCLPVLGLNLKPAPGWVQRDFTAVRKMRRFGRLDFAVLNPGAAAHCCTISMGFKAILGGRLEFETGSEHPLGRLPNFEIMCVAGAGNYPSKRMPFQVPAASLKALITQHMEHGVVPILANSDDCLAPLHVSTRRTVPLPKLCNSLLLLNNS